MAQRTLSDLESQIGMKLKWQESEFLPYKTKSITK